MDFSGRQEKSQGQLAGNYLCQCRYRCLPAHWMFACPLDVCLPTGRNIYTGVDVSSITSGDYRDFVSKECLPCFAMIELGRSLPLSRKLAILAASITRNCPFFSALKGSEFSVTLSAFSRVDYPMSLTGREAAVTVHEGSHQGS
jgi:hypothetical protein